MDEIATAKKMDVNTIKTKLAECGEPGITGGTVRIIIVSTNFVPIFYFRKLQSLRL